MQELSVFAGNSSSGRHIRIGSRGRRLRAWLRESPSPPATVVLPETRGDDSWGRPVRDVADALYAEGWTVCVLDLVSEEECQDQLVVFDVPLLAERLADAIPLVRSRRRGGSPPLVIAASGNAAAAAFWLAAESHSVAALISMSGRPHLAEPRLGRVTCPTLLLAPQGDDRLVHLNRMASRRLGRQSQFIALSRKPKGGRSHEGAFTECSLDWLRQALPALWEKPKRPSRPLLEWGQGALSSRLFKSLSGMILAFLSGHHPRW